MVTAPGLPLLIEPAELEPKLGAATLLLVDLNRPEVYAQAHLPGAVRLDYADITAAALPATGLLPGAAQLSRALSAIGLTPETHVVAYDSDGNSRAARLLWTLDVVGHRRYSLLNGGLVAWQGERRRVSNEATTPLPGRYQVSRIGDGVADKQWILDHLADSGVQFLDARSAEEFDGTLLRAQRGGHIPGAVNYDYTNAIDQGNALRLKPTAEIQQALGKQGLTRDKEIVVYCQTHHRSAHTWFVLKLLGFPKVRGYPGSWSEWGNSPDTPIESG